MDRNRRLHRRRPIVMGLAGLVVALSGCPLTSDDGTGGLTAGPDLEPLDRSSVFGAIEWFSKSWAQKRLPAYQDVLHDQFEFRVTDDGNGDFLWWSGTGWGRATELEIARNMFDANFIGQERPVDTIEFVYTIINQRSVVDAQQNVIAVEVTCDANLTVLVSQNDGWVANTCFVFEVVEDPRHPGLYQIKRQVEKPISTALESETWAGIKARYRK